MHVMRTCREYHTKNENTGHTHGNERERIHMDPAGMKPGHTKV